MMNETQTSNKLIEEEKNKILRKKFIIFKF